MNKRRRHIAKRRRAGVHRATHVIITSPAWSMIPATRPARRCSIPRRSGAFAPRDPGHRRARAMSKATGLPWRYERLENGGQVEWMPMATFRARWPVSGRALTLDDLKRGAARLIAAMGQPPPQNPWLPPYDAWDLGGQPAWDTSDYQRDYTWHGFARDEWPFHGAVPHGPWPLVDNRPRIF